MDNLKSLLIDAVSIIVIVCLGMVLVTVTIKFITCYIF